jgi:hypothetical protein
MGRRRSVVPYSGPMRILLTSNGIANDAIRDALIHLIGVPSAARRIVVVEG